MNENRIDVSIIQYGLQLAPGVCAPAVDLKAALETQAMCLSAPLMKRVSVNGVWSDWEKVEGEKK